MDSAEIYLEAKKLESDICICKYDSFDDEVIEIFSDYFCINYY